MPRLPLLLGFLLLGGTTFLSSAQWLEWDIQTDERLVLTSVANADDEEKTFGLQTSTKTGGPTSSWCAKNPFLPPPSRPNPTCC